jgi:type IV pilus assembly protein PilB
MISNEQLKKIISEAKAIPEAELDKISEEAKNLNKRIFDIIIEKKLLSANEIYEKAAAYYKVPFIDLKDKIIRKDILALIPEPIASAHQCVAYDGNSKELKIATMNPGDIQIFEFIKKKTGLELKIHLTTQESIDDTLKQYHKSLKAEFQYMSEETPADGSDSKENLKKIASNLPIVKVVDTLLEYAIFEDASDVHIEPEEKEVYVRYRVDGILRTVMTLPKDVQPGITARIKILANLKVDEHRLPQDGRFKIANKDYKVAFRVSIMPTFDGEKIVMRLLNEKAQVLSLEQLGMQKSALEALKRNITKPHGMFLVTGPTGSGKTTTLYTVLNFLNRSEVNISTIEDPIEYRMPHINQSQINPKIGYTFALGLRAFLRQDPDIIMVGEIRDQETAEISVHAAMTGHLVLSTLHTNDAITTLPRLNEMGVPTFLIASTVNIIIAQRLVRKICPNCIQSFNLEKGAVKEIEDQLNIQSILKTLEREKAISTAKDGLGSILFYRGKGCSKCSSSGYKGRVGIYEVLEITDSIAALFSKKTDIKEIETAARDAGMISIAEDGFIKAKNGITTIEEILRVTKE